MEGGREQWEGGREQGEGGSDYMREVGSGRGGRVEEGNKRGRGTSREVP